MKIVLFASGSTGNCTLVSEGDTHILIDAGISARRIRTGLQEQGLTMNDVDGVLITHEHSDHIRGLTVLLRAVGPWDEGTAIALLTAEALTPLGKER